MCNTVLRPFGKAARASECILSLPRDVAFCELEDYVCNLTRAAHLASEQLFRANELDLGKAPDPHEIELAVFAVDQVMEMAVELQAYYYHLHELSAPAAKVEGGEDAL